MNRRFLLFAFCLLATVKSFAQFTITPSSTTVGCGSSATLTALPACADNTMTLGDDQFSGTLPIGFNFQFYGNVYSNFLIASNGYLSFNLANAGGFSPWSISSGIPSNAALADGIAGAYTDILIPSGGTVSWGVRGTAPNRKLVVTYCNVALYNCTTQRITFQIMLYERTNVIEVHTETRTPCGAWNGGAGIQGVENPGMTAGTAAPGRNFPPGTWTATNDAFRYTPNASYTAYAVNLIAYNPEPGCTTDWYDGGGAYVGTGNSITVAPSVNTTYRAVRRFCNGTAVNAFATVNVVNTPPTAGVISAPANVCGGDTHTYTTTGTPGGTWSGSGSLVSIDPSTGVATFGTVTSPTVVTITYTVSNLCGTATVSKNITIYPDPSFTVTSPANGCVGAPFTLGVSFLWPYSSVATSHTYSWSTGSTSSSMTTSHSTPGSYIYTVTVTNGYGCSTTATPSITVYSLPNANIEMCPPPLCVGQSAGVWGYSAGTGGLGGTWSSSPAGVLSLTPVSTSSVTVTGASAGVATLTFTVTHPTTGCKGIATCTVTVNPTPTPISGSTTACIGNTMTLSSSPAGGAWSSSSWAIATVSSIGGGSAVVTGIATGTATIAYSFGACSRNIVVTVQPSPTPVIKKCVPEICEGNTETLLGDPTYAGAGYSVSWTATPPSGTVLTLSSPTPLSVDITGTAAGTAMVTYTVTDLSTGCTGYAVCHVRVHPAPLPVSGPPFMCEGQTVPFTAGGPGMWISSDPSVATVDPSGNVTGVAGGTATISYGHTLPGGGGCFSTTTVDVIPRATACVKWDYDPTCGCNAFIFTGTPGANVTYDVFDCGGTHIGTVSVPLDPVTGQAVVYSWMLPSGGCSICLTQVDYMGCSWRAFCCESVGAPKPARMATEAARELQVIPNPNKGTFVLKGSVPVSKNVQVQVLNVLGEVIYTAPLTVDNGQINQTITPGHNLANGVYLLKVTDGSYKHVLRFTLEK